jgi:hypothetical protein
MGTGAGGINLAVLVSSLALATPSIALQTAGNEATTLGGKLLPLPDEIALPAEQTLFNELTSQMARAAEPKQMLRPLNAALARVPEPTKLRGFIQFSRAELLFDNDQRDEALEAVAESVRLLPEHSGPLLLAATLYSYANQLGRGADYLLRAAALDP